MELQDSTKKVTLFSMNFSGSLIEEKNLFTDNTDNNTVSSSCNDNFGYLESSHSSDVYLDSVNIAEDDDLGNCTNFAEGHDLGKRIASWAIKHKCTRDCTNDLLKIQEEKGHNLPKDR